MRETGQGAEGATAPETLRQTDRAGMGTLESVIGELLLTTEGEGCGAFSSPQLSSQVTRQRGQERRTIRGVELPRGDC